MDDRTSPDQQVAALSRLSEEILPEGELLGRIRRGKPLRVKYGMDPTAPDLHLGSAIALHKLKLLQDLGHVPVVIVGDYTALIGDPSGVNRTRPMLTEEQVRKNAATYVAQLGRIIDLDRAEVRMNSEWLAGLEFREVVALCSRATVARLIERDDFSLRLEGGVPIGVHELLYPVMQGYDSVVVEADIEIGGTDQKFNLLFAREMQKAEGMEPQIIMTHPILEGLDGMRKMSKSLGNYVGITDEPRVMFGRLMSLPDAVMPKYFRWATDLPEEEVAVLLDAERTHPRDAKEALGKAVVRRYHPEAAADDAADEFRRIFSEGKRPDEMPEVVLGATDLPGGRVGILALLSKSGFTKSASEARRLLQQGAVSLEGERITDLDAEIAVKGGEILRVGKRRFARVVVG